MSNIHNFNHTLQWPPVSLINTKKAVSLFTAIKALGMCQERFWYFCAQTCLAPCGNKMERKHHHPLQVWQCWLFAFTTFIPLKDSAPCHGALTVGFSEEPHCSLGHTFQNVNTASQICYWVKNCVPSATSTHMLLNLWLLLQVTRPQIWERKDCRMKT